MWKALKARGANNSAIKDTVKKNFLLSTMVGLFYFMYAMISAAMVIHGQTYVFLPKKIFPDKQEDTRIKRSKRASIYIVRSQNLNYTVLKKKL